MNFAIHDHQVVAPILCRAAGDYVLLCERFQDGTLPKPLESAVQKNWVQFLTQVGVLMPWHKIELIRCRRDLQNEWVRVEFLDKNGPNYVEILSLT